MTNSKVAPHKLKIPRAKVRRTRRRSTKKSTPLDRIERLLTRFLKKRVGRTWDSVYKSLQFFNRNLDPDARTYVEALYDTYVDLHPRLRPDGTYERQDGIAIDEPGLFFVDLSGILRGSGDPKFTRVN